MFLKISITTKRSLSSFKKHFLICFTLVLSSCIGSSSKDIHGTWQSKSDPSDGFTFSKDGLVIGLESNPRFETITSVRPHQLYLFINKNGEEKRVPFAIWKRSGKTLTLSLAKHYGKTMGSIPFGGVTRSEFPENFNGIETFEYRLVK